MTTTPSHALDVRQFAVDELQPYIRNPRIGNVDAIARSLEVNGQYRPVVVNIGSHTGRPLEVLAGNHTLKAARSLGWTTLSGCTVDVDEEAAARIVTADNRTADLGGYNDQILAELLAGLPDLDGTGYSKEDLDALLGVDESNPYLADPDDIPAVDEAEPVSRPGDVWHLGPHVLVVGDGTSADDVERATQGEPVDLYLTDPPYNVDYTGGTKDALKISGDKMSESAFENFLEDLFSRAADAMRPGAPFYIFHAHGQTFRQAATEAGLDLKQVLIWVKNSLVLGRQDHQWQHEPILYGWKPGAAHTWFGGYALTTILADDQPDIAKMKKDELRALVEDLYAFTTVVRFDRPTRNKEHPTMKPVGMLESLITRSTRGGGLVLDTCAGSGSTLIACHGTSRRAAVVEIDPRYADVICRRYQTVTGIIPTRDGAAVDFTKAA